MKMFKTLTLAVTLLLSSMAVSHAGVARMEGNTLIIAGSTDQNQATTVMMLGVAHKETIEAVRMSGPGGDARSMVQITDMLLSLNVPVTIPKGQKCASACAIAALAGSSISIEGKLMFHMGYIPRYPNQVSLQDILQYGQGMSLNFTKTFYKLGFKQQFLVKLIAQTGPSKWFLVLNDKELNDCRMKEDTIKEYFSPCTLKSLNLTSQQVRIYTE